MEYSLVRHKRYSSPEHPRTIGSVSTYSHHEPSSPYAVRSRTHRCPLSKADGTRTRDTRHQKPLRYHLRYCPTIYERVSSLLLSDGRETLVAAMDTCKFQNTSAARLHLYRRLLVLMLTEFSLQPLPYLCNEVHLAVFSSFSPSLQAPKQTLSHRLSTQLHPRCCLHTGHSRSC